MALEVATVLQMPRLERAHGADHVCIVYQYTLALNPNPNLTLNPNPKP